MNHGLLTRYPGAMGAAAAFAAAAVSLLLPGSALAHGGLIGRQDLPLPEWLFLFGCAVVLIVSFVGLTLGWRKPLLEGDSWRVAAGGLGRAIASPVAGFLAGLIGVAVLVLVLWTGLDGVTAPDRNFSVTFVFVTFWVAVPLFSVFFGNFFRAFNPWLAIGRAVSAGFAKIAGQRAPAPLAYPERLGRWPAVVGIVGFLFLELVYGQTGFAASGLAPRDVAVATLVYSAITFVGMGLFGVERWVDRGEAFSVYFGMFASLSPLEVRDGRLGVRRPLSGAPSWVGPAGSVALVLTSIGGTTFDGASEGLFREPINSVYEWMLDSEVSPLAALRLTNSLFLIVTIAVVALIFWAGIFGMRIVEQRRGALELGRAFGHAFIPIAFAYLLAHYFSLVVFQEQAQFTYLLSDPFGDGSNYLGTAGSGIDYTVVGATLVSWVQFGAIVLGHVAALALGHDRALAMYKNTRDAAWSQVWMLVLMMFFSMLGLYLLSQANG